MLKQIAFAAVLIQVAVYSALLTQTILFASTASQAANAQQLDQPVAVKERVYARQFTIAMTAPLSQRQP
ncbi:hypothetical protein X740_19855 [Mesorhizobium sp. LNHC221B00]|uniref:hypothetical protein n=1 Tax=Mesorhizobium sp. LNHC221B00 TaxID=1287233 RepID=UPI0003CF2E4B|nr:hypothetical protein [Mesorhizobium sp. LNHC221B00]ESY78837.1 hypothetical protein X740_19855 [Mesorhizobium sp. LNHC221B00]